MKHLVVLIVFIVAFGAPGLGTPSLGAPVSQFEYPTDADHIVVDYQQRSGRLYYGEPELGLKLFGNGRMIASLPEHFPLKKAERRGYTVPRRGFFEAVLTPQEIEALLQEIEGASLLNPSQMKSRLKATGFTRGHMDGSHTNLSVSLTRYRSADQEHGAVEQKIAATRRTGALWNRK